MDKRSGQKIVSYVILWMILLCLGAVALFMFQKEQQKISMKQANEMIIMHPNQEFEIAENNRFYEKQKKQIAIEIFGVYVIAITIVMSGSFLIVAKHTKKELGVLDFNLHQLENLLEQLKKGNFEICLIKNKGNVCNVNYEQWNQIWDKVTELAYYFSELKEQLAEEENNTKSLISDISHQLKTPLASLRMSHELLLSEELTIDERNEFFHKEEVEIHRLELLLQELVNLSRLESHMIQINPEQNGIKRTITEAMNVVIMKAIAKNIQIQVSISEDTKVFHDSKWTVEAIANVLDNAIKYSAENKSIYISTHKLPNLMLIEIEDEGIGIPAEEMHKIFQRFYRGKEAIKMTKDGAGIGLYLTRRVIEQQGGIIVARRKQEKGTIFKISLPL